MSGVRARLVLACVVALGVRAAEARVVLPPMPSVSSTCRMFKSWAAATKCIERFGSIQPLRTIAGVRVIRVMHPEGDAEGAYVFAEGADKRWYLSGDIPYNAELVALEPLAAEVSRRIRVDLVQSYDSAIRLADESVIATHVVMHTSMFCPRNAADGCSQLITRCEERVHGKTTFLFVGKLTVEGRSAVVRGDTSRAGTCAGAAQTLPL